MLNLKQMEQIINNGGVYSVEEAADMFEITVEAMYAWASHCKCKLAINEEWHVKVAFLDVENIEKSIEKSVRIFGDQCPYCHCTDLLTEYCKPLWSNFIDIGILGSLFYEAKFVCGEDMLEYSVGNNIGGLDCDERRIKINYCPMCGRKL